ncbi:MAG: DUF4242 domain-containing protein [Actinobacteria bacterium]|nr:DUF4242 domain-containing protein [Actinomycetota bacterium]
MRRFLAIHPVAYDKSKLGLLAKLQLPPGVTWRYTWCALCDGKTFCEWEAPCREAVEQIFKDSNTPYEGIYEVEHYDVKSGDLD